MGKPGWAWVAGVGAIALVLAASGARSLANQAGPPWLPADPSRVGVVTGSVVIPTPFSKCLTVVPPSGQAPGSGGGAPPGVGSGIPPGFTGFSGRTPPPQASPGQQGQSPFQAPQIQGRSAEDVVNSPIWVRVFLLGTDISTDVQVPPPADIEIDSNNIVTRLTPGGARFTLTGVPVGLQDIVAVPSNDPVSAVYPKQYMSCFGPAAGSSRANVYVDAPGSTVRLLSAIEVQYPLVTPPGEWPGGGIRY